MTRTIIRSFVFSAGFLWTAAAFGQAASSDASATGISRAFNPAISVHTLFYGMGSSEDDPRWEEQGLVPGLHIQEVSLEMTSNVDVYLQGRVTLSASEEDGLEVEEAYLTTLQMPIPLVIRFGQMLNTFGRHNLKHLHHMAFAEPPMILQQTFGPDLNELGFEASYLVPVPWFMDFTLGALDGQNPYLFDSDEQGDLAYLVHLDNLWDLDDEWTLRLGGSYLTGRRGLNFWDPEDNGGWTPLEDVGEDEWPHVGDVDYIMSEVWGADLHLKWRPLERGRYRSFTLQAEYMEARLNIDGDRTKPLHGYFVQALGQFNLRYWVQARYDWFNRPSELNPFFPEPVNLGNNPDKDLHGDRMSFAVAYAPTEFSAYRLQYNVIRIGGRTEYQVVGQVNITIGSHPAHDY